MSGAQRYVYAGARHKRHSSHAETGQVLCLLQTWAGTSCAWYEAVSRFLWWYPCTINSYSLCHELSFAARNMVHRHTPECYCTTVHTLLYLLKLTFGVLQGSDAAFKNELLFNQFGINYNNLPEQFRKVSLFAHALSSARVSCCCLAIVR